MTNYANYDLSELDPYLIEGSECLKNKLNITDTQCLNEAEHAITVITLADLIRRPVPTSFDLLHLKAIHFRIFSQVYPFAGEIRRTEIGKGGQLFLPYHLIESEAQKCFEALKQEHYLRDLAIQPFAERAGYYLGWINNIHPFREGNGRTQRVLVDQLAAENGYAFTWSAISPSAMISACREARTMDQSARALSRLLACNIVIAESNRN